MKINFLLVLIISVELVGCGNKDPYADLNKDEQKIMYQKAIEKEVGVLLCNAFITESFDYEKAKKERAFIRFHRYFTDYHTRFDILKSELFYPQYKYIIELNLKAKGLRLDDVDFKDMSLPEINALGCDDAVVKWAALRGEWARLERTLPDEFFIK